MSEIQQKEIVIADITTLTKDNQLYGHFSKVAKQLSTILSERFDVKIAGGTTYSNYFDKSKILKLNSFVTFHQNKTKFQQIRDKFKELRNANKVLQQDADVIVFQCYHQTPVYLMLLFQNPHAKVLFIQYQFGLNTWWKRLLYRGVANKISGTLTSSPEVLSYYNVGGLIVPDYFPIGIEQNTMLKKYDLVIVGTISSGKNYEDVIRSVNGTNITLLIAGYFSDKSYKNKLKDMIADNVTIIDKYLTTNEYNLYVRQARYVCLPYTEEYLGKSSGVVLDALYNHVPVVSPRLDTFRMIEKFNLGIQYDKSLNEILAKVLDSNLESHIIKNIDAYIELKHQDEVHLGDYIDGLTL